MCDYLSPSEVAEDDFFKCAICFKYAVDTVLLNCLHSACRSCTGDDIHASVTCPTCQVTTDIPAWKTNLLVSSRAQRSLTLNDVFSCTQCMDDGNQDMTAVAWCYTCQHSLCVDCQKIARRVHATHKVMHLNESTNLSELYRPPTRFCSEHKEEVKFACFTCKVGNCLKCAHHCYKSDHDVLPFDCPDALKRMNDSVAQATDVLSKLNSAATQLQAHLNLPEKVLSAREESIALLKGEKKSAIDAISNAYENTEKSLLECWDCLTAQSLGLREKAERFRMRVSWTNKYCQMALKCSDIAALLPQLDEVSSSLQYCFDEARQFQKPAEPSNMVRLNTWLPSDLNLIAIDWFGSAKLLSDDFYTSSYIYPSEENIDYYTRKVATQSEVKELHDQQKELREQLERERKTAVALKADVSSQAAVIAVSQNELMELMNSTQNKEKQLERNRVKIDQQQFELQSKTQQLAASQNEVRKLKEEQQEKQKQLDDNRVKIDQLQSELQTKTQLFAVSQNEMRKLKEEQQEKQKQLDGNRVKIDQLQSELQTNTQLFVSAQSEAKKYLDQQKELQEHLERERSDSNVLKSDVASKTSQLAVSQNELKALKNSTQEQEKLLERNRVKIDLQQSELQSKTQQLAVSQNELKALKNSTQEQEKLLEQNRVKIDLQQSELQSKTQQLAASQNEVRKLKEQQQEQQIELDGNRVKIDQLQSELQTKTQLFAAPTKPLSFGSRPRGTFKGPSRCWDVAVTPHGSLLVAATADGLKEYDATSFREMATWKPDSDLLGQGERVYVRTVDVLSDGRAVVGLHPKHVVLLRRSVVSGSSAAAAWRVERRLAELQAPPRRLSTWDDLRLLAVLEDRWDESTKSWWPGPGLLLLSLNDCDDGGKQQQQYSSSSRLYLPVLLRPLLFFFGNQQLQHSSSSRLKLQYNALSVALTDRGVMVASSEQVELSDAFGSRKCYVVDCYSHLGVRLWRHEVRADGLCTDSVGRVLYAAKRGSVVALCVDDGRELSTAITLGTKETERTYAVTVDRATQRLLALISLDANDEPNIVTIFSAA